MTLILELPPEAERALEAKARVRGLPVQEYARFVLEHDAQLPDDPGPGDDSFDAELDALLLNQGDTRAAAGLGPLPEDAIEKDYYERETTQL